MIFSNLISRLAIDMAWMKPGLRRPMTGVLFVRIISGRYLQHLSEPEAFVVCKIDGKFRSQTKFSRMDRWNEEFEFAVEKANELEIIIYNVQREGPPVPIGLFWIPISELTDDLRKKNAGNTGWAPADATGQVQSAQTSALDLAQTTNTESVESWWKVEPTGEFLMRLKFGKPPPEGNTHQHSQAGGQKAGRVAPRAPGCRSQKQGNSCRTSRPQIRGSPVLPGHDLRLLRQVPRQQHGLPVPGYVGI